MPRWFYSLVLYLLLPFAAARFWWRARRNPVAGDTLGQRLGRGLGHVADAPVWLHAASVGELRSLVALLAVMDDIPGPRLVTVGTATGLASARQLFAARSRVRVLPAPWDLPGAVHRFLDAVRPTACVIVETELWPNLIAAARGRGVPLFLVSARLSERSLRGYRRWAPALLRATVRAFAAIGAQSEEDRQRFVQLGAAPERISVAGSLKFDMPLDPAIAAHGAGLRIRWAANRPLWVAGSTHAGEEAVLIEAHRLLREAAVERGAPPPLLAMAPRRPERFATVARWLHAQPLRHVCTTAAEGPASADQDVDVVLIDEMGVLLPWYAAADAVFVGGSLVPVGGHNLIEPAALGRPVLTGPCVRNAPDVAQHLVAAGGACVVSDAAQLASRLTAWLGDGGAAAVAGAKAAAAVAAHRGAAMRARGLLTVPVAVPASAPSASG